MENFWLLYFITRLGELKAVFSVVATISAFALVVMLFISIIDGNLIKYTKSVLLAWAISCTLAVLTPTRDDVMFIGAGIGITEAAKSQTVKNIAGKSVQVIENYLDEQLKKGNK